jgi:hypothetical protein
VAAAADVSTVDRARTSASNDALRLCVKDAERHVVVWVITVAGGDDSCDVRRRREAAQQSYAGCPCWASSR